MFSLKIEAVFSAAHNLRGYKGNCEELHGHNWKVELVVTCATVDEMGMVMDFRELRNKLDNVLQEIDHKYLNNIAYFKEINPTSENIAKYLFDVLKPEIGYLKSITVWESATSSAIYEG
ncbi:MAG: 6-carboxytetrahydropterin synthase QueD [Candidatus Omnitrophota bacterium]